MLTFIYAQYPKKVKDVKKLIEVGELIVHKDKSSGRKRFGEVVGLVEGRPQVQK